jgi:AraC family transcriptional regulator, activator of mtrCDE
MDTLSDILRLLNLRASVYFHSTFCGNWSLNSSDKHLSTFHLIARGSCQLYIPSLNKQLTLQGGDLIVLPRNTAHSIKEEHTSNVKNVDNERSTSLICGYFDFQQQPRNPILEAMPDYVHIKSEDLVEASILDDILRFMSYETDVTLPGADVVIDKLSEILFIYVVRAYIQQNKSKAGYLALLMDEKLHSIIKAIHDNPGEPWSVAGLAEKAGMSRSSFARFFHEKSAMTPMQYVTSYRMHYACKDLEESQQSVAQIAGKTGYTTEASFRKAFKNYFGIGPGAVRKK